MGVGWKWEMKGTTWMWVKECFGLLESMDGKGGGILKVKGGFWWGNGV